MPAGDNSGIWFNTPGTTYWFASGTHTIGSGLYNQIAPGDNTTFLGAPGAILNGQGINRYAFTQKAANVTIKHLTITGFIAPGDEGIVNHDFGPGWVIERNTIEKNNGAGVMLGNDNRLAYNCLANNGQYGFQGGGKNLIVDHNEVSLNNTTNWETNQPGCGCSGGAKFWSSGPGTVTNNWVHDNQNVGLWWDNNNVGFRVEGNLIEGNRSHGLFYETSYNALIRSNTFRRNAIGTGQEFQARGDAFPIGSIYLSEAGGEPRVNGGVYPTLEISRNRFEDNWGGIVAWENADRFGHDESANTSKSYTTLLVEPSGVWSAPNMPKCGDPASGGLINTAPYFSDCRWRTVNLKVTENTFVAAEKASIGCTTNICNKQGLFSNYGSYPSWSPYKGRIVQDAVTFNQNNKWANNAYTGTWDFVPYEMGNSKSFAAWQAAPYNQDAGSTYNGSTTPPTTTPTTTTPTGGSSFVSGQTLGRVRNDFTGTVGFKFTVGAQPVRVSALGRWVVAGNSRTHTVKLSNSSGVDLAGGSVTVATAGRSAGTFAYVNLPAPITLAAGATYYLGTEEVAGLDQWYDHNTTITTTGVATVTGSSYRFDGNAAWYEGQAGSHSYGTVSFL